MGSSPRIVITGMGVLSPIGQDLASFDAALFAGTVGIAPMDFQRFDKTITYPVAAVKDFDPTHWLDSKKIGFMDRFAQLAAAASRQAADDAKLALTPEEAMRTGVILGTGVGGQATLEESYARLYDASGSGRVHPFTIPRLMVNAGASHISMTLGVTGPSFTVASACASALHAMGTAVHMMRTGLIDRAVTGGAESCLTLGTLRGWEALRVMAPDVCRPFSKDRSGMVLGEGAAILIFETLEAAQKRGAKIYAEVIGFGMTADAKDLTTPDQEGAARAIRLAMQDAGLAPEQVDYINAHGTGTRINDTTETAAIKEALGAQAYNIPISSSKSMFGHALGAAGALEMVATVQAIRQNCAPPTQGYVDVDPTCDLDYVPNKAREHKIDIALNNAFAFGGLNAVMVVKKYVE